MVQFSGKPWYSKINRAIIFSKKSTIHFLQKIAEKIKLFLGPFLKMNITIRQSTNVRTLSGVLISSQSFNLGSIGQKIFLGGLWVQIKKMLITLNSNPVEAILQLLIGPERFLDLRAIQTSQRDAEKLKILLFTQIFRKNKRKILTKKWTFGHIWG